MNHQPFTWEQHAELGGALAVFRDRLNSICVELSNTWGKNSLEARRSFTALAAIDRLLSALDDRVCAEHREPEKRPQFIYYPNKDARAWYAARGETLIGGVQGSEK